MSYITSLIIKIVAIVAITTAIIGLFGCAEVALVDRSVETVNNFNAETGAITQGANIKGVIDQLKDNILSIGLGASTLMFLLLWLRNRGTLKSVVKGIDSFKDVQYLKEDSESVGRLHTSLKDTMKAGQRRFIRKFRKDKD